MLQMKSFNQFYKLRKRVGSALCAAPNSFTTVLYPTQEQRPMWSYIITHFYGWLKYMTNRDIKIHCR